MKHSPYYVLSLCGTSLLTHRLDKEERALLTSFANAKNSDEVPAQERAKLLTILESQKENLMKAKPVVAAELSAELKSIVSLYNGHVVSPDGQPPDTHVLICTDTWLGEYAGLCVGNWLNALGVHAQVERFPDLQTENLEAFQLSLTDLVSWCDANLTGYQKAGYRIIFNLTAGFKSISGFLQTLAMFYADESVYIFEGSNTLLRIPRLPVRMHPDETIKENLRAFRRLAIGLSIIPEETVSIEETLLMHVGSDVTLSTWGALVWKQTRSDLYKQEIFPTPSDKIRFGINFEKSVRDLEPQRRAIVNDRIDDLAGYLEGKGANLRSLDFKMLKGNPMPPSTHEMDAWADQDAKRMFGYFENDVFVLDRLDNALH
jgi:CRISPR/Cas system-associated protein Csm6